MSRLVRQQRRTIGLMTEMSIMISLTPRRKPERITKKPTLKHASSEIRVKEQGRKHASRWRESEDCGKWIQEWGAVHSNAARFQGSRHSVRSTESEDDKLESSDVAWSGYPRAEAELVGKRCR